MSDPSMDVENLENQQDQEDEKRRPVLGIPLILIVLLLVLVCGGFAVVNGLGRVEPSVQQTEEAFEQPVIETTEEVVTTEEATQEATDEATQEATREATEEATAEPTEEVTAEPTEEVVVVIVTEEPAPTCGDGTCTEGAENSDLCNQDCPCMDDGTCASTETDQCADCGATAGTCSNVCSDDSQCAPGLSCVGGSCQSAAICQGITGEDDKKVSCSCKGDGPYAKCSDGSTKIDFSCDSSCYCEGDYLFCSNSEFEEICSPACGGDPNSCQAPG
jgi:hypothetical protein